MKGDERMTAGQAYGMSKEGALDKFGILSARIQLAALLQQKAIMVSRGEIDQEAK